MATTNYFSWLSSRRLATAMDDQQFEDKHPRSSGSEHGGEFRTKPETISKQDSHSPSEGRKSGRELVPVLYFDENGNERDEKYSPFLKSQGGDGRISKQLNDILDRLFSGENVPDEEIEATPEWSAAMATERRLAKVLENKYGVTDTSQIDTPERNRYREGIMNAALAETISKTATIDGFDREFETNEALKTGESYKVAQDRVAVVAIGFPAAGKSTTYANPLARKFKARLCDSDAIKKALPEFENGYGGNLVHEESTQLNEAVLAQAVERGDNVIYPILGFKPDKLGKVIDRFKEKGYRVALCFKDMPVNIAKGRLIVRFLKKGRYLPLSCISKAANGLAGSFNANKGNADSYVRSTGGTTYPPKETILEKSGDMLEVG